MMARLRDVCKLEVQKMNEKLVFGEEVECISNVEIDEACFGKKRKNNKGKRYKKQWVFGITQRDSRKVFFTIVENRTKLTLLPLITKYISHTATVHHDDWPSYRTLSRLGYKDLVVNHTKSFKGPGGACTNTIEGLWGVMKQRIIRMHGVRMSKLDSYLCEFTFRDTHRDNRLDALICGVRKYRV